MEDAEWKAESQASWSDDAAGSADSVRKGSSSQSSLAIETRGNEKIKSLSLLALAAAAPERTAREESSG